MTRLLHRLGSFAAHHPWRTVAAWAIVVGLALGAAASFGGTPVDDYDVPGIPAQAGIELLRADFPAMAGAGADVVVQHPDGAAVPAPALAELTERLAAMDHVVSVAPPRMSADGDTALLHVQYDVPVTDPDLMGDTTQLKAAVATARDGLTVHLGGEVPGSRSEIGGTGELVGVGVAIVLLVLTFGSVVAAGLPLAGALIGLAVGGAGITLLAATTDVSTSAPTVATMVGLGVGIDYGLLLVTRYVELLRAGHDRRTAAALATATAGRSIVLAGATVLVSLLGLRLAGLPVYDTFGYATAFTVTAAVLTSITLVPALAAASGPRLLARRERRAARRHTSAPAPRRSLTARWAARVGRRPPPYALGALALLAAIAAPVLDLRTWPQDAGSQPTDSSVRQAFDVVSAEFGSGANAPLLVVADLDRVSRQALPTVERQLAATDGVAAVAPAVVAPEGGAAVIAVEPAFAPSDARTTPLVDAVRAGLPDGVHLTGGTPVLSDISVMLEQRMWLVLGVVVALSVLLLMVMFRSVVVPLKAAVMNLLSIGAAYGVVVAVFQWGWGLSLLGLDHAIPVSSWVPILMFTILFGLSMDYEVFLISRVREDWLATGDPRGSVVHGLAATGRVISAAAAIMVAVFVGFATESDVTVAMLGVGMAAAIAVDATLVRLVLVPATMALLGRWNWWMPRWLDRVLPRLDAEVDLVLTPSLGPAPALPVVPRPRTPSGAVPSARS